VENKVITNYELLLPAMGEGIIEATITKWLVSAGQHVNLDQPLVEVATDKVDSEIPSPLEGTIVRLVYREGEIPRVGEVIALIETEGALDQPQVAKIDSGTLPDILADTVSHAGNQPSRKKSANTGDQHTIITPLVRMLARQRGLSSRELELVEGTGINGRITKEDINRYIANGRFNLDPGHDSEILSSEPAHRQEIKLNPEDEVVEMDRMRKLIAAHMIASTRVAAHVTSFLEADVTALVQWREEQRESFFRRENARLTFTPVFIEAVAQSLKDFPRINVTVSGSSIIFRRNINIGVATALADGNLIVPVIKNADHENLGGLSRKLTDLANRARNGTLLPEEIKGGTFTLTNIGQYNNLTGTPIINQPESAILAFGTILKKPWAVKTAGGYGIAVRDIMMLALTYDHRIIDGALGGSFLSSVAKRLENFTRG
jgi:2-oxoglutarate dehydrogenase E2 component (dihydrolipoamide succinyltransferase)